MIIFLILLITPTEAKYAAPEMPRFRVLAEGFGDARPTDIQAVIQSTGRELWRFFPNHKIEPLVVRKGKNNPLVLYSRNPRGEIIIELTTSDRFWCQYAYQFSHEFCHILCGYDQDKSPSEWFEETICETASLFSMRAMAKAWESDAPYPNWVDYRHDLKNYTDKLMKSRPVIAENGLADFYQENKAELNKTKTNRELNGAIANLLLKKFEAKPEHWQSIRWLNPAPAKQGETFDQYLAAWYNAAPEKHRIFIADIAAGFGITIQNHQHE